MRPKRSPGPATRSEAQNRRVTVYGACAVTFMMLMYALEKRGRAFILAFACGCVLSSVYGFISGVWPFGVVELIWAGVAFDRWRKATVPVLTE